MDANIVITGTVADDFGIFNHYNPKISRLAGERILIYNKTEETINSLPPFNQVVKVFPTNLQFPKVVKICTFFIRYDK